MQDYNQASAYVSALTQQDANTAIIDIRCIHDTNKELPAHNYRGTLPQLWNTICDYNNRGYGIFANINEMGTAVNADGRLSMELSNVTAIRCNAVDFDNLSAAQNFQRACAWYPQPTFGVNSSPNKFHGYWITERHIDKDKFTLLQRKLRTFFDGDKTIIDPTRVLRLPGTYHLKGAPHLVTCFALGSYGQVTLTSTLEIALAQVNVIDSTGGRKPLGDASLQAPGLDWIIIALRNIDPNSLDRGEWVSFTSAIKQAAWNWADETTIYNMWCDWCARYNGNDPGENAKAWNSIRDTEVGWKSIERRIPTLVPMRAFGERLATAPVPGEPRPQPLGAAPTPAPTTPQPLPVPEGEFLSETEQADYFAGCIYIERLGEIMTPSGRFMNAGKFNGTYGGKKFVIDQVGKFTDEAWKAATRSTLWNVPRVDHTRFIPFKPHREIIVDALGRKGVNTYRPAIIDAQPGDITPFLNHMALLIPNEIDRKILFDYIAHNIKHPGFKIPWAPLIQSVEGAGKGVIKSLMQYALGLPYNYFPNAQELANSGSKFNAWMRNKLFIIVDEIRVGERFELVEILKPMISEKYIEVQGKGQDQEIEDNFANWWFFSNHKDAIPVNRNSRRFAMFFSPLQNADDLAKAGMNDTYFAWLYHWLDNGGASHVTHWMQNYPIERGSIPMRAPITSSTAEAMRQSRGPVEVAIMEAIDDGLAGFRQGWVSSLAVARVLKAHGHRNVSSKTLGVILEAMGYHHRGRAQRMHLEESREARAELWCVQQGADVAWFGQAQGYIL